MAEFERLLRGMGGAEMQAAAEILLEKLGFGHNAGKRNVAGEVEGGIEQGSRDFGGAGSFSAENPEADVMAYARKRREADEERFFPDLLTRLDGEETMAAGERREFLEGLKKEAAASESGTANAYPAREGESFRRDPAARVSEADMRAVSDFFERDSRRYDREFQRY